MFELLSTIEGLSVGGPPQEWASGIDSSRVGVNNCGSIIFQDTAIPIMCSNLN
jgi:hypothetical protein